MSIPAADTKIAILLAYRHLLRASLRAVSYSAPNKYIVRDRLRRAFRASPSSDYDESRIANTLRFLDNAARDRGLEHRLVKSLCRVWLRESAGWNHRARHWDTLQRRGRQQNRWAVQAYDGFYWNLRMLNESMGLCIR